MIAPARPYAHLTDAQVITMRCDAEMMRRPHLWPHTAFLPLTRGLVDPVTSDARTDYAYLIRGARWIVLVGLPIVTRPRAVQYDSPEAIVTDGWIVD